MKLTAKSSKVRESLVRFGHTVNIFFFLDRATRAFERVHEFTDQFLLHRFTFAGKSRCRKPTERQGILTIARNGHRHLIIRSPNPTGSDFNLRPDGFNDTFKNAQRFLVAFLAEPNEGAVHNILRDSFLAIFHNKVNKLGEKHTVIFRIRRDHAFWCSFSSGHTNSNLDDLDKKLLGLALRPFSTVE